MGLTIDRRAASERFQRALELARGSTPAPGEWIERTRRLGLALNKTFIPMLGTALLAKATDRRIDALSLRESAGHKGYSARSLAKEVLVPCCAAAAIDIRSTGAEPLNNQPFLRAERVGLEMNVKANARADLEYLVETLKAVDFLEDESALVALSAFLRRRIEETKALRKVTLGEGRPGLLALEGIVDDFVASYSEGGKVGQAVVAGILDAAYDQIETKKINDPSNRWPGDVGIFVAGKLVAGVEVKQRPFTDTEIFLFARRLEKAGVEKGFVLALRQERGQLEPSRLRLTCQQEHQVEMAVIERPSQLLRDILRYSMAGISTAAGTVPETVLKRLEELEASTEVREAWAQALGGLRK